jgi:N-acetylneuraminate synthase
MPEIKIGDQWVGDSHPTYIIAEIGVNHNGILDYAFQLVDSAVNAGADAVKFQKRNLEKLYPVKLLENSNAGEKNLNYLLPILQRVELSDNDYYRLVAYCKKRGITFLCSAFDEDSADFVEALGVPAYKIASADMINLPLLDYLVQKGKPMIVSTGMSRWDEVVVSVNFLKERNATFALLHCNSAYPASFDDINLRFMDRLREFGVPVGYSGHERGIAVSTVASAMGACIIERHITLDRTMDGPDHAASLEPQGFTKMVRDIRQVSRALGTGKEKYFTMGEILNREVLAKSLVANEEIHLGDLITREKIAVKGPGQGLSPQRYTELIGCIAAREIGIDEPFFERDLGHNITLDLEKTLPMPWGFVVRFKDYKSVLAHKFPILEFHFSDKDLDEVYPGDDLDAQLVVHAPEFWGNHLVDLCTFDESLREKSIALLQKSIYIARDMAPHFKGIPKIIVHPGAASLDHPIDKREILYDNLRRSVEALDIKEVELLIENLPPHPWYFGGQWFTNAFMDTYEIRDFLDSMGLNTCYDTSHSKLYCNLANVDFYDQVEVILPYISHLHLSDASGLDGEGLQIGMGSIDWVRFFKIVKDYRGTMIPEIWRGHQRDGEGFIIAINKLTEAYFKAIENVD